MNWIKAAADFVWPFVKPLVKSAAKKIVEVEGDALQQRVKAEVASRGVRFANQEFDIFQARVKTGIDKLRFCPDAWREKAKLAVQEEGDKLQSAVLNSDNAQGGAAPLIDAAFDAFQAAIIARIDAL